MNCTLGLNYISTNNPTYIHPKTFSCKCTMSVFSGFLSPRHPLFPLLALLFEKCEQSTQGSEGTTSASFDVDIENFVRKQEKEGKPFFCEDPETDNLVSKISVLFFISSELKFCSTNFKLPVRAADRLGENRPVHELTSFSVCVRNGFWPSLVALCCDNQRSWFEPVSSWTGVHFSPKRWYRCLRAGVLPCFPSQAACLPSFSTWLSPIMDP